MPSFSQILRYIVTGTLLYIFSAKYFLIDKYYNSYYEEFVYTNWLTRDTLNGCKTIISIALVFCVVAFYQSLKSKTNEEEKMLMIYSIVWIGIVGVFFNPFFEIKSTQDILPILSIFFAVVTLFTTFKVKK